jgi:hypothetical protein
VFLNKFSMPKKTAFRKGKPEDAPDEAVLPGARSIHPEEKIVIAARAANFGLYKAVAGKARMKSLTIPYVSASNLRAIDFGLDLARLPVTGRIQESSEPGCPNIRAAGARRANVRSDD